MAREIQQVAYFKIEVAGAAAKLRDLISARRRRDRGALGRRRGITLLADLDAGATGTMTGGGFPDGIRRIVDAFAAGRREEAIAGTSAGCR